MLDITTGLEFKILLVLYIKMFEIKGVLARPWRMLEPDHTQTSRSISCLLVMAKKSAIKVDSCS